ncbi:MAG: bifunctional phosphoribosylaminoimidazolecarboxamide formyltransferase/IMP cyclohydrolase [Actinobacteria bacterium]|nr:bifunctional phosphoribosylaminoimidazolecarboxamide formyltransferase/IMP cyclohydrolase [Actinomycetota bacterium]
MTDIREVRRALLAVYDKTGVVELARGLAERGVSLVSSGGTAATLREGGLAVTAVEEVTGFPEMLDGRVKTLHPRIHGGLLADKRKPEHLTALTEHGIEPFDLVVVNLYPFRETVASGAGVDEVIEKIDIGGPAMVRAAAKNFESVGVVVDPSGYPEVLDELRVHAGLSRATRERLAAAAFAHTAAYDAAVAGWFAERAAQEALPGFVGLALEKVGDLRYGENPHQRGALYRDASGRGARGGAMDDGPLGGARVLQGKDMSFNNWLDAEAAYSLVAALPPRACVIVKHNNPCGVAVAAQLDEAYRRAFECDSVSAFGGIVAFDVPCTGLAAEAMRDVFTEVVIAPGYEPDALAAFGERQNLRVLEAPLPEGGGLDVRTMPGGALVQDRDVVTERREAFEIVSSREPTEDEWRDLLLAWTIAWRVKSNTIVLVRDGATVGIGAGQMSRVDSSWIATRKAGDRAKGASLASDAFFPFPDALEVAADAGATAVIHPGGSKGDDAVLRAAEERGMAVVLTGRRHFRH